MKPYPEAAAALHEFVINYRKQEVAEWIATCEAQDISKILARCIVFVGNDFDLLALVHDKFPQYEEKLKTLMVLA